MDTKIWFLLTLLTIVRSKDLSEISEDFGTNAQKLFDENKKANPAIWRQIDNITITAEEGSKINKIIVTDLREEKDGEAKIVEGGLGQGNVTIELKSPTALRGYDFHIEVYADTNGQASINHEDSKQATVLTKLSEEKKPVNVAPSVPISLIRDEPSSTTKQPIESLLIEGKRQSRDTEDKEKSNKQLHPHSLTDVTTEVPELKSTGIPTIKDKREDSMPLNKKPAPGIANLPIHLQEAPKMPESTARSVLTTEFKIAEEKHDHHEIHDDIENKKEANFDSTEKQTNINHSQFIVREVTPNVPVNVQSPAEDSHKRHARDVTHNTPVLASTEHPLPPATFGNQATTTKLLNVQTQTENKAIQTENNNNKENVTIDNVGEKTNEHHHHNNRYNGRYVPDRFARKSNPESTETSTENNKVSKSVTIAKINSAQSTPIIPKITGNDQTTPKTETGKQVNADIPELHINNKDASEEVIAKRVTRDTATNNKEPVLPTDNIKDSPTLKPEIKGKSELDINASKINIDDKAPTEASEKHDTPKTVQENKETQRNARGTEDKEKVSSSSTAKPENKEHEEKSTDKTEVPVELKSNLDVKEKERITRDVIDVPKTRSEISSPTEIGVIEKDKKIDEKVTIDNKSLVSVKDDKQIETTAASINTKSETSKIEENTTQVFGLKNQPGKFPREVNKEIEVTNIEENKKNDDTSNFSIKSEFDTKKEKVEPKQPEKSLVPPQ